MILTRDGKEITAIYRQDGSEIEEVKDANGRLVYLASREITGTLPLYFSGRGKPLTDYLISGNAVQDGTPSADAPVDAAGCGVRTGNLFDKSTVKNGYYIDDSNGNMGSVGSSTSNASDYIYIGGASNIYISAQPSNRWGAFYDSAKVFVSGFIGYGNIVIPPDAVYVRITVLSANLDSMMLNLGSTALPYEPYGYKLPPTVNGIEYPIYLGQVETTRKVKKWVLDGTETWSKGNYPPAGGYQFFTPKPSDISDNPDWLTTHFKKGSVLNGSAFGSYLSLYPGASILPENATANDFKSYLAAQYATGTPVTVWYVLAEPVTGIVNEPLMKIGGYVDTISFAQAEVVIPTVNGANVLDMTSTVKPSEVYIKGKGIKQNGG